MNTKQTQSCFSLCRKKLPSQPPARPQGGGTSLAFTLGLASFLPLLLILSLPPSTAHKVPPQWGLKRGPVELLNLSSWTVYVNEHEKCLHEFQAWKNVLWPHFAPKQTRFTRFTSVGWQGALQASAACRGIGEVVQAPRETPQMPWSCPSAAWGGAGTHTTQSALALQAETQPHATEGTHSPHGQLPKFASFLSSSCWPSLGKSFIVFCHV